ncbi:hypothetical protein SAMN04489860_1935 [Paraoerskovia marina]|uniref:Alpha/beta hydrolase n=2 Tax=Paraoerskovia marina TaxID=545619 RepID=A0A1H1TL72_9CELL|nr:hypothetical protein SAMN04489860_1935 [Paraoerskovia marina]
MREAAGDRPEHLRGDTPAGDRHLVLLHGRGAVDLRTSRREWMSDLAHGARRAGLVPPEVGAAWLPSYGDALVRASDASDRSGVTAQDPEIVAAEQALVEALARSPGSGDPPRDLRDEITDRVRDVLEWVADNSPLDEALLALAFRDVALYLSDEDAREQVRREILDGLPPHGETVLVAHSLGSVAAIDLLCARRVPQVSELITCGSPLGLDAVQRRIGPAMEELDRVRWTNVWSADDPVTVGSPLRDDWGHGVVDVEIRGERDDPHAFGTYLGNELVAAVVVRALRQDSRMSVGHEPTGR